MNRQLGVWVFSAILLLQGAACAQAGKPETQQNRRLSVDQIDLRLEERSGSCSAVASVNQRAAADHPLGIPWPCNFHTDGTGAVRTIQGSGYVYALVESSQQTAAEGNDCETHLRSIRLSGRSIDVSQHQDRVASCPPFQWDTMLFRELFD